MSIGKRFVDMARAELNSLLDRAAERARRQEDDAATEDPLADDQRRGEDPHLRDLEEELRRPRARRAGGTVNLRDLSDDELAAEIERRARARGHTATGASSGRTSAPASRGGDPVRRAYRTLELPYGADQEAIKHAYRTMMRKYHPDRHTSSPDKQKAAHELSLKLTEAYRILRRP